MSDPEKLTPLADDPSIDVDLRAALDAASAHEPTPGDLAGLQARLAAALPPGTLPPAPAPPAGPAGGAAIGGKVAALIAAGAIAAAAAATLLRAPDEAPPPGPSATTLAPAPPSASPPPPASAPVEPPPVETSPAPEPKPSARVAPRPAVPEATLLQQAHDELLRGSAARALAIAGEHQRAYPTGALAQEREVIAIEALVRLGRVDEARRRAKAFHAAYPGSSHAARIDRLVE
jgi:hypothetical protein